MADEPSTPLPAGRNSLKWTALIVLGVAVVEGGAFFAVIKLLGGGPSATYGSDGNHVIEAPEPAENQSSSEVVLLQGFKVPNNKSGHTIIYDFDISVAVPQTRAVDMNQVVKAHDAEIRDRVSQIVRQARPRVLEEDDFGTLRLLLKRTLNEVSGDDELIQRVLIPRCLPIKAD